MDDAETAAPARSKSRRVSLDMKCLRRNGVVPHSWVAEKTIYVMDDDRAPEKICGGWAWAAVTTGCGSRETPIWRIVHAETMAAEPASSNPSASTRVPKLTNAVTAKLKIRAMNPAFNPRYGSRPVSVKNAAMLIPTASPARTPRVVTRLEKSRARLRGKAARRRRIPAAAEIRDSASFESQDKELPA